MIPRFETTQFKCDDCKTTTGTHLDKDGNPRWYKNKQKGIGFLCKRCYMFRYHIQKKKQSVSTV